MNLAYPNVLSPLGAIKDRPYRKPFKISSTLAWQKKIAIINCNPWVLTVIREIIASYKPPDVRLAKDNYNACCNHVRKTSNTVFKINYIEQECTFDYRVWKHNTVDSAMIQIGKIVRGADTDRFEPAPQSARLSKFKPACRMNIKTMKGYWPSK